MRAPGSYAGLTVRQADLLSFIRERAAKGETPSYQQMADAIGLESKSGIYRLVMALEERGYVERIPNRARAVRPLEVDRPLMGVPVERLLAELVARGVIVEGARL